jgi:hypothetical protein
LERKSCWWWCYCGGGGVVVVVVFSMFEALSFGFQGEKNHFSLSLFLFAESATLKFQPFNFNFKNFFFYFFPIFTSWILFRD